MSVGKGTELALRAVAFSMLCALITYILFVLAMAVIAIVQIAIFIFLVMSVGWNLG